MVRKKKNKKQSKEEKENRGGSMIGVMKGEYKGRPSIVLL